MTASIKNNPGLFHTPEDIFNCLDKKGLMDYRLMDNLWKHMMLQPGNVPEEIMKTWEILALELHQNNQFTNWDHFSFLLLKRFIK